MCTKQEAIKWMTSISETYSPYITIPTGIDENNYIAIDHGRFSEKIHCIYKYDIDDDKWNTLDGSNNIGATTVYSATLDVKKQILFLFCNHYLTEIELNNNYRINHYYHPELNAPATSKNIIINGSLFIIGGCDNNSIFKWDL
eukprot:103463_1